MNPHAIALTQLRKHAASMAWGARNLISTQVLTDRLPRAATALLRGGAPEAEALLRYLIEVMWVPSQGQGDEALVEELRRIAPATTLGGVAAQLLAGRYVSSCRSSRVADGSGVRAGGG